MQLKKLRTKNKNIHLLPVRGNTRVLNQLKNLLYSRMNPSNIKNFGNKNYTNTNISQNIEENKDELNGSFGKIKKNYNKLETYNSNNFENEANHLEKIRPESKNEPLKENDSRTNILNRNFMKNFSKELEVFENGEWYLIDILEEINIEKNFIPVYGLFNILNIKLCPSISRKTTFNISKMIDDDLDGYISYSNLIQFLLDFFNHSSIKLAFKEMARILELEGSNIQTLEFFKKSFIKESDELNSVNFMHFVIKIFNLPN